MGLNPSFGRKFFVLNPTKRREMIKGGLRRLFLLTLYIQFIKPDMFTTPTFEIYYRVLNV